MDSLISYTFSELRTPTAQANSLCYMCKLIFGFYYNPMTTVIVITGSIAAIVGVGVATWSIVTTRKKYCDEYMKRKRGADE